jgi:hypothetical protein
VCYGRNDPAGGKGHDFQVNILVSIKGAVRFSFGPRASNQNGLLKRERIIFKNSRIMY